MTAPIQGYKGKISAGGTSTATTGEACSLVSGKEYQVTNAAKRVLDPAVARTWKDNGIAVAASNIASEDLLFGTVTFAAGYTVTGPVTLDGSYIPRTAVASVKGAKASLKLDQVDVTTVNQSGYRQRANTVLDLSGSLSLVDPLNTVLYGTSSFMSLITGRAAALLELDFDGTATLVLRAWVLLATAADSLDPASVVMGDVDFNLVDEGTALALAGVSIGAP